jgi:hypothetical protein
MPEPNAGPCGTKPIEFPAKSFCEELLRCYDAKACVAYLMLDRGKNTSAVGNLVRALNHKADATEAVTLIRKAAAAKKR